MCKFNGNNRINNNCVNGIQVNCVSLDDYFSEFQEKIFFIKIDVEGLEPKVLSGMKEILKKNPRIKILLEYNPTLLQFYGYEPKKLLESLIEHRFNLFDLEYDYYTSVNIKHFIERYGNTRKVTNILAVRV